MSFRWLSSSPSPRFLVLRVAELEMLAYMAVVFMLALLP